MAQDPLGIKELPLPALTGQFIQAVETRGLVPAFPQDIKDLFETLRRYYVWDGIELAGSEFPECSHLDPTEEKLRL